LNKVLPTVKILTFSRGEMIKDELRRSQTKNQQKPFFNNLASTHAYYAPVIGLDRFIKIRPQAEKNDFSTRFFNIFRQSVSFQIEFSMILCFLFDRYEFWNNSFSESFPKIFRELAEKQ
jgi:hypothetical protein